MFVCFREKMLKNLRMMKFKAIVFLIYIFFFLEVTAILLDDSFLMYTNFEGDFINSGITYLLSDFASKLLFIQQQTKTARSLQKTGVQ
jgi:hypothetical protein